MSLIAARIQGAARARRFQDGYEPEWIRKAAVYFNADEQAKWDEAAATTTLGALQPGDGFRLVEGSSAATHGIVKGEATGIGMVMVDTGTGNRYLPATTAIQHT